MVLWIDKPRMVCILLLAQHVKEFTSEYWIQGNVAKNEAGFLTPTCFLSAYAM